MEIRVRIIGGERHLKVPCYIPGQEMWVAHDGSWVVTQPGTGRPLNCGGFDDRDEEDIRDRMPHGLTWDVVNAAPAEADPCDYTTPHWFG